ncbi:multidrug transporter [Halobacteriales archaeon QS_3_64_16]|nr:MAG: multidrug transporter [Halobacteriales archaeon QS_3_64_16]
MSSVSGRSSSSTAMTVLGVLVALIAVIGTTFLGWEWSASFAEQPIPFVLGACVAVIAIAVTLRRRL